MGFNDHLRRPYIRTYNLCFLGFGNVNRTLVRLLEDREQRTPRSPRNLIPHHRNRIAPSGMDRRCRRPGFGCRLVTTEVGSACRTLRGREGRRRHNGNVRDWLAAAHADVLFEATSLNVQNGEPAVDHIRAALEHGAHAITANKGPIVHAYRELRDLAATHGKRFLFESTVMDGVPIFSLFDQMPTIHLQGFHGILNSTTNVILSEMEQGLTLRRGAEKGAGPRHRRNRRHPRHRRLGRRRQNRRADHRPDGCSGTPRRHRARRHPRPNAASAAQRPPRRLAIQASLPRTTRRQTASRPASRPEKVLATSPMGKISGTSSYIYFETDIFPGLAITEENPGLYATAYGMLADFVRAVAE